MYNYIYFIIIELPGQLVKINNMVFGSFWKKNLVFFIIESCSLDFGQSC